MASATASQRGEAEIPHLADERTVEFAHFLDLLAVIELVLPAEFGERFGEVG